MKQQSKRLLAGAGALTFALAALAYIVFGGIGENLVYYWSPSEVLAAGNAAYGPTIRLGGLVEPGSVRWDPHNQSLDFEVSDGKSTLAVHTASAPPQMFREGIGVVVEGFYTPAGVFDAQRLMVKHSNEYKAPAEGVPAHELYRSLLDEQRQ